MVIRVDQVVIRGDQVVIRGDQMVIRVDQVVIRGNQMGIRVDHSQPHELLHNQLKPAETDPGGFVEVVQTKRCQLPEGSQK